MDKEKEYYTKEEMDILKAIMEEAVGSDIMKLNLLSVMDYYYKILEYDYEIAQSWLYRVFVLFWKSELYTNFFIDKELLKKFEESNKRLNG